MMDNVQLTITVSRNIDASLRRLVSRRKLGARGLSRLVERALRRELLAESVAEARGRFRDLSTRRVQSLVNEAVSASRKARRR